jgi:hypothetical protein
MERMKNYKNWLWFLLFGSLWGLSEVIVGEALWAKSLPYASVLLSAWALLMLAMGRGIVNVPGSSTTIGAFAALFKLVNAAPFFCHLLGIFALGLVFDIASSLLMKRARKFSFRSLLTGILSAYGGYALFALLITYVIRYDVWTRGGLPKVLHHIFISGSYAALTGLVAVPLGFWVGINGGVFAERRPRWAYTGALVALAIIWTLGRIVG